MLKRARNPAARRRAIQRELVVPRPLSVEELSRHFDASPATIRRDLVALEKQGVLQRSHGGAVVPFVRPAEQALAVREHQDVEAKRMIARAVLGLLESGQTIFLNDGSTAMAVARELITCRLDLFVATPGVNVATILAQCPTITVCLLGGYVRADSLGTVGHFAEEMIDRINANLAFIAPDALAVAAGITFSDGGDAAIARKMMAKAGRSVIIATARKLGRTERIAAGPVEAAQCLITDDAAPVYDRAAFRKAGLDVVEATGIKPSERANG